jgi:hypothetical protein
MPQAFPMIRAGFGKPVFLVSPLIKGGTHTKEETVTNDCPLFLCWYLYFRQFLHGFLHSLDGIFVIL